MVKRNEENLWILMAVWQSTTFYRRFVHTDGLIQRLLSPRLWRVSAATLFIQNTYFMNAVSCKNHIHRPFNTPLANVYGRLLTTDLGQYLIRRFGQCKLINIFLEFTFLPHRVSVPVHACRHREIPFSRKKKIFFANDDGFASERPHNLIATKVFRVSTFLYGG